MVGNISTRDSNLLKLGFYLFNSKTQDIVSSNYGDKRGQMEQRRKELYKAISW